MIHSEENDILKIEHLSKSFGDNAVIRDLSFSVSRGEFVTILGSSGCGKTTLIRIIGGFEEPDGGKILLKGRDITDAPPNKREVNTVFQNYALFPHMTVFGNIAYPLKVAGVGKAEREERVREAMRTVQLGGEFEKRYPASLSGGQKQRVAIARAVISRPSVLLLDEPLGALDLNLRRAMQKELKELQKELGITFIYITHDQEEALNMSDRVALMKNGRFLQFGTPSEIYDSPECAYVAHFVGEANVVNCTYLDDVQDGAAVSLEGMRILVRNGRKRHSAGDTVSVVIREEKLVIGDGSLSAVVRGSSYSGGVTRLDLEVGEQRMTAVRYGLLSGTAEGETVRVAIPDFAGIITEADDE